MVIQSEYTQMYTYGYISCKIKLLVHSCILKCIENHKCIMIILTQSIIFKQKLTLRPVLKLLDYPVLSNKSLKS